MTLRDRRWFGAAGCAPAAACQAVPNQQCTLCDAFVRSITREGKSVCGCARRALDRVRSRAVPRRDVDRRPLSPLEPPRARAAAFPRLGPPVPRPGGAVRARFRSPGVDRPSASVLRPRRFRVMTETTVRGLKGMKSVLDLPVSQVRPRARAFSTPPAPRPTPRACPPRRERAFPAGGPAPKKNPIAHPEPSARDDETN